MCIGNTTEKTSPCLAVGRKLKEGLMSLLFSKVTIVCKTGQKMIVNESGHPDEYDLLKLFQCETRYAPIRKAEFHGAVIRVCQYRFSAAGRDWLAEQNCFALMDAYDELALQCGKESFVRNRGVELLGQYTVPLNLCELSAHKGALSYE